jgi:hypothetical protein
MAHHEMSMALADRRLPALAGVAKPAPRDLTDPSSRLKDHAQQTWTALDFPGGAHAGSTMTSASGAGPMGCCP